MVVFILIVWGMMNIKKDKKVVAGCGCNGTKGTKVVVPPPVSMAEAPDAKPGFAEPQMELTDSGRTLEPMPIESDGSLF
jgi:hypothetical protein